MKQLSDRSTDNILAIVGLLVALPAIYFFTGSFLKYEMNLLTSVDLFVPPPVVMLGGLLFAIILNLYPLVRQRDRNTNSEFTLSRVIKTKLWNIIIFFIGGLFLTLLLGYVVLENLAEMSHSTNIQ